MKRFLLVFLFCLSALLAQRAPNVDDLIKVKRAGGTVEPSPDGRWVAYTVRETSRVQKASVTQIWLTEIATRRSFPLTRGAKSSTNPQWSPDSRWLAFTSSRDGGKDQIFVVNPLGGEPFQVTKAETGVGSFVWSPDGKSLAFVMGGRKRLNVRRIHTVELPEALHSPVAAMPRRLSGRC